MTLSPVSEVLINAPQLKPISDSESPKPLQFDPLEFFDTPPSPYYEGVLRKGSHILNLSIKGDFIETQRLIPFKTTQDVFFSVIDNHMLFSLDQKKWKSFDEVFSWNIALDFPLNAHNVLEEPLIECQIFQQKTKIKK